MIKAAFLIATLLCSCLSSSHSAELLVAYLGFVEGPSAAFQRVSGCNPGVGIFADGMPVTFDVSIRKSSISPDQFRISSGDGTTYFPTCATLEPADAPEKGHTILLTGDYVKKGLPSNFPTMVEIVLSETGQALESVDGDDLTGLTANAVHVGAIDGPQLALAFWYPTWGEHGQVQIVWEGGVTADGGDDFGDDALSSFFIIGSDGQRVNPTSFDDIGNGDNYMLLNLPSDFIGDPLSVEVDANVAFDPMNFPNPITSVKVRPGWYGAEKEDPPIQSDSSRYAIVRVCAP